MLCSMFATADIATKLPNILRIINPQKYKFLLKRNYHISLANKLLLRASVASKQPHRFISTSTRMTQNISTGITSLPVEAAEDESIIESRPLESLEVLPDDADILANLRQEYSFARQESTSKWLDYMKSCYIYLYRGGGEPSEALAAFDLDGTIIKPRSNKRIPRNATDWQFFSAWTKVKVEQAVRENQARFVVFTNQNGVGLRLVSLEEVQERIELVTKRLNIPCTVFVAIDQDEFRKPKIGMFRLFEKSFNDSFPIDYKRSFYCGDAIGYPSHSDADLKFAQALGLRFLPPDKFVRGVKPKALELNEKE